MTVFLSIFFEIVPKSFFENQILCSWREQVFMREQLSIDRWNAGDGVGENEFDHQFKSRFFAISANFGSSSSRSIEKSLKQFNCKVFWKLKTAQRNLVGRKPVGTVGEKRVSTLIKVLRSWAFCNFDQLIFRYRKSEAPVFFLNYRQQVKKYRLRH